MNTKQVYFFLMIGLILLSILQSCSDDTQTTNPNQNTGGTSITPIGTPNGTPVSGTIGSTGGNIISADSSFEVNIPAGALSSNTVITLQPLENYCFNGHGNAYRLTPEGQQFSQPITVKFHYTEEVLSATYDILMGIAVQDGSRHWHCFNNITNDTINRVISLSLNRFGYQSDNSTGGGDISFFDIAHIEPRSKELDVNETVNMTVTYVALPGEGDDVLTYLPKPIQNWSVNSIVNGNSTVGIIMNRHDPTVTYKAPSLVPTLNTVFVQALVNTRVNHRGHVIETFLLQSTVKIKPNIYRFHLKINQNANWFGFSGYPCFLTDGLDMDITVNNNTSVVNVTNVLNRFPNVGPPSGTYPDGSTVTWSAGSPPDPGHINVTGNVTGFIFTVNGRKFFTISFTHTGTKNPLFHVIPPNGPDYWLGGETVPGTPPQLTFVDKDSNQTQSSYGMGITLTVTP